MEFFDSFVDLYNTNYEVRAAIKFIGFIIAFICIHDSIESFTPAKPIVRRVVRSILCIFLFFGIYTLLMLLIDNGLL